MKLVCEVKINGVDTLKVLTTAANTNHGAFVRNVPGIGKKFWLFPSIPAGTVIAADFTDAPTVSADVAENNVAIVNITAEPEAVLTYA